MLKKIKDIWAENRLSTQTKNIDSNHSFEFICANDDRGVLNVGGRVGASLGPDKIRALLGEYMLGMEGELAAIQLWKGKSLPKTKSIEEAHSLIRNKVKTCLELNIYPIVLGGGHDYGYPHFAGVKDFLNEDVALINVDAHLDVRKPNEKGITSGSPFYLSIESGVLKPENFIEFGIQSKCNDQSLSQYCRSKKINVIMLDDARSFKHKKSSGIISCFSNVLETFTKKKLKIVVSFDLDCVQMAYSPGVSAPQADGFTSSEFLQLVTEASQCSQVVSVGFFEFAPDLDLQNLSAHLICTAIHKFISARSN